MRARLPLILTVLLLPDLAAAQGGKVLICGLPFANVAVLVYLYENRDGTATLTSVKPPRYSGSDCRMARARCSLV